MDEPQYPRLTFQETPRGQCAYVSFRGEPVSKTVELVPGRIIADYDFSGYLIGIEILEWGR